MSETLIKLTLFKVNMRIGEVLETMKKLAIDAGEEILSIPTNHPRMPLQEGELELISAMVYGYEHPLSDASWGELNERGMFWAAKTMETLANYEPYEAEKFGAEMPDWWPEGTKEVVCPKCGARESEGGAYRSDPETTWPNGTPIDPDAIEADEHGWCDSCGGFELPDDFYEAEEFGADRYVEYATSLGMQFNQTTQNLHRMLADVASLTKPKRKYANNLIKAIDSVDKTWRMLRNDGFYEDVRMFESKDLGAEEFGAEEGGFYQLEVKHNMEDGWEHYGDYDNEEDATSDYYDIYLKHPEVQLLEVDSEGDSDLIYRQRNLDFEADALDEETDEYTTELLQDMKAQRIMKLLRIVRRSIKMVFYLFFLQQFLTTSQPIR